MHLNLILLVIVVPIAGYKVWRFIKQLLKLAEVQTDIELFRSILEREWSDKATKHLKHK